MTTPASRVPVIALALSLVAFTACDKDKAAEGEAKSDDKTEKADDKKAADAPGDDTKQADASKTDEAKGEGDGPAPTPTPTASGGDGVAYIAVNSKGIAKLDASGWSMVDENKRGYYNKMFLGADGNVYVVDFEAVKKIDGSSLTTVAKFDFNTFSGASHVVTSKDGSKMFAAGYSKYGTFADGKWAPSELKDLHADIDSLTGIAIAGDDTLWVSASKSLLHNKGGTWTPLDLSSLGEYFYFSHLSSSPTGDVFVTNGQQLVKLTTEKPEKIDFKSEGGWASYSADLAYNNKGHVLAASLSCELVRVDPAKPSDQWTVKKGAYNCLQLQAVALDGQDRAWVASREGLSVVGSDKTATEYPSSTVMELVGSYVQDMVVVGNGPALPAPGKVRTAGVTGKVLVEGTAVANSKIEMCPSPSWGGSQPCFDSKVKFAGTTNEKGEFTFENVPIGTYTLAVEVSGKWQMHSPPQMSVEMKEGSTYDIGSVKLNPT
ncbi:MAG: hypothetical protein R6X02_13520 [Enhygromyxa sp.]